MNINISYETVDEMLDIIKQIKCGQGDKKRLERLLEHRDYCIEFERYNRWNKISKEEFVEYILNFPNLQHDDIKNRVLWKQYDNHRFLFDNLEFYIHRVKELNKFSKEAFMECANTALKWLPADVSFDAVDLNFIFTVGVGASFGWPYENYTHYDVVQLFKDQTLMDTMMDIVTHELHHLGIDQVLSPIEKSDISLEDLFYLYFSAEGLAVKYINNAEGIISKRVHQDIGLMGLHEYSWIYLNSKFETIFKKFLEHRDMIRNGQICTREELDEIIKDYWISGYTDEQSREELPKLYQPRLYSLGNELWGVIHDVFGMEKVYETIRNPRVFPQVYNDAVKSIGMDQYII